MMEHTQVLSLMIRACHQFTLAVLFLSKVCSGLAQEVSKSTAAPGKQLTV